MYSIKNIQTEDVINFKNLKQLSNYLGIGKDELKLYLDEPKVFDIFYIYTSINYDECYFIQCKFQNYELPKPIKCENLLNGRVLEFSSVSDAHYKLKISKELITGSLGSGNSVCNYKFHRISN